MNRLSIAVILLLLMVSYATPTPVRIIGMNSIDLLKKLVLVYFGIVSFFNCFRILTPSDIRTGTNWHTDSTFLENK